MDIIVADYNISFLFNFLVIYFILPIPTLLSFRTSKYNQLSNSDPRLLSASECMLLLNLP